MNVGKIILACWVGINLVSACDKEDQDLTFPLLTTVQLQEILSPPRSAAGNVRELYPLKNRFKLDTVEKIYETLKDNNFSRRATLLSLKHDLPGYNSLFLPLVNKVLQAHLKNMYGSADSPSVVPYPYEEKTYTLEKVHLYKKIIWDCEFDYRKASDRVFKMHSPYKDLNHAIQISRDYERYLDFIFSTYARPIKKV